MDDKQNALSIAEIKGEMKAIRAENEAMESRIDASLAKMRADMERRDKENQRWIVGLFIATIVILGILIRWPAPPA